MTPFSYHKVIVLEVTTICNLSCPFCAHDNRLKVKRQNFAVEELKKFTSLIGEYALAKNETILISWLGGEPFLYKQILPLTEALQQKYPLRFSATTNGLGLSNKSLRDHIKHFYSELTISIDGFADFHDNMRGSPGLFEEIKKNILLLSKEAPNLKLRINCVLMKDNFDSFEALCMEISTWGIKEITFNQLGGRDRPEFYPENRLSFSQVKRLPEIVSSTQEKISSSGTQLVFSENYFKRILATTQEEKLPILNCGPGMAYMFVNAQGIVSPCPYTTEEYGIASSTINTVDDFDKIPLRFKQQKFAKQAFYCQDCPCTNVHGKFS